MQVGTAGLSDKADADVVDAWQCFVGQGMDQFEVIGASTVDADGTCRKACLIQSTPAFAFPVPLSVGQNVVQAVGCRLADARAAVAQP